MKKILAVMLIGMWVNIGVAAASESKEQIVISSPWVRALPATQPNTAGYMKIKNNASQQRVLLSAESSVAEFVELHQMRRERGMMSMNRVDQIVIPPKQLVELMPNGYHLMLINLKRSIKKGDAVPIVLHFDQGLDVTVEAIAGDEATKSCCLLKKEK